jgi:nucleoside-diphosphate-sugar epimerase
MKCLVTGGQGFVGRHLIAKILDAYPDAEIVAVGRSPGNDTHFTHRVHLGTRETFAPLPIVVRQSHRSARCRYHSLDITDVYALARLLQEVKPEIFFHMASGLRDDQPTHLFRTNVEGTVALFDAIAETGITLEKLVLGSSGSVYDANANVLPLSESATCMPSDLYAVSKLAAEHASRILSAQYGIPTVWARMFNLVGPGQDERHVCGRIAAQAAAIVLGIGEAIEVGDLSTTRDFIDVRDVASALLLLAEKGVPGTVYNVGSGIESSIQTVVDYTIEAAGLPDSVVLRCRYERQADIKRQFAKIERLTELGFHPSFTLRDSIASVFDYYVEIVSNSIGKAEALT